MMASWAFVLSGLILVISVAVPSKKDSLRLKISSAGSEQGLSDNTEPLVDTGPESDSTAIAGEVDKNDIAKDDERTVISNEDDKTVIAKEDNGSAADTKGDRTATAKKDDRNVIVKENNRSVISKQDGRSAVVTESDRSVTPQNDERTAIPTEANQPAVPKDDERIAIPRKPSKSITSKDDGRSAFPKEGDEPFTLNKDEPESEMTSSLTQSEQELAPDDLPADFPKGFEAGRGAQDKWLKDNGHKLSTGDSKAMSRAIRLMKVFFSQPFKLTTNSSQNRTHGKTSALHRKLLRNNKTGSEPFDKSRMEKAMSILAIFGENMETALTERQPEMRVDSKESSLTATPSTWLEDVPDFLTSCIHVDGYDDHRWVQVVNVCPQDWSNQTILYLCRNVLINDYVMTDTPVQDSRGTVYANRFCALCNNVTKIRKWRIGWICEDENPVAPLFHPPQTDDIMQMVTTLRRGNTCKLIRTPAITDAIRPCPSFSLREHHEMPVVNGGDRIPPGSGYPVSLNILMNFDFSGKTHIMFEDFYAEESYETKRCPRGNYVWDGDVGRCREVVCAKGFHFDDTYTTCIPDDGPGDSGHDDGVITDLSQLAQSNDIERVTLTVEVPSSYILIFLMTDYHQLWKSQIATQLNITINRIQKFNITVEEATGEANTLVIEKLSNEQLQRASAKTLEGVPLLKELPRWREGLGPQDYDDEVEGDDDVVASSVKYVAVGDVLKDEDVVAETEALSDDDDDGVATTVKYVAVGDVMKDDDLDAETEALSGEDVLDASVESVTLSTHRSLQAGSSSRAYDTPMTVPAGMATTLAPRKNAKIIMTFILLPPESFRSGEQRSGHLVEELSSLVSKGELKFTINGTSLKVDNMAEEDNVEVFRPACPNGLLLVLDGEQIQLLYESDPETGHNITMLMDLRTGKVYPRGMFDVSFLVTQPLGNTTQKPHSFVYNALACEMPHIVNSQCKRIRIKADEYTIDSTMKDLTFQNSTYNISSYEFVDDNYHKVEICVPDSYSGAVVRHPSRVRVYKNCGTGYEHWLQAEGYLTAVLGRVSIVALFSVLLTYFLFPKLRNLPGVNTMNLTFALFLAEIIFVTGEQVQIPWLCTAVAVCLHYCFLASHCWMNVMSYDVYRTFAGATCILTRVRDKNKFFPRYALYAWGTPLLVTGVCLFIDLSHVFSGISIGYGGTWSDDYNVTNFQNWPMEGSTTTTTTTAMTMMMMTTTTTTAESVLTDNNASGRVADDEALLTNTSDTSSGSSWSTIGGRSFSCWIQKPLAAMFAFGAPILLIFLVNCVLFSRTIASIRKTNRLARHSGAGRTNSSNSSRQLSGRNDVILYVKMASVMGFTWVFGLASSVISSVTEEPSDAICYALHVLGVLFPILNSSQGLFIFVAFVLNRRVLALYKSLGYKVRRFLLRQKEKFAVSAWGSKPMTNIATISRE